MQVPLPVQAKRNLTYHQELVLLRKECDALKEENTTMDACSALCSIPPIGVNDGPHRVGVGFPGVPKLLTL